MLKCPNSNDFFDFYLRHTILTMKKNFLIIIILLVVAIILIAVAIILLTRQDAVSPTELSDIETSLDNISLNSEEGFEEISPADLQYSNNEEVSNINSSLKEIDDLLKNLNPATDFDDLGDFEF